MDPKIETRHLDYSIQDISLLKDINVKVPEGKIIGIVGPNACGKTTLLQHIYRGIPAKRNTVFINGEDLSNYSSREAGNLVSVVKQEAHPDFDFTVERVVLMGRSPCKRTYEVFKQKDYQVVEEALKTMGLTNHAKRSFKTLSGGEKQRVLIARALAQEAEIILLDEPTNHLDIYYRWSLMSLLKGLNLTVVVVFHELNLASRFCDELYVMKAGSIVANGTPKDVITPELLEQVFRIKGDVILKHGQYPHIVVEDVLHDWL